MHWLMLSQGYWLGPRGGFDGFMTQSPPPSGTPLQLEGAEPVLPQQAICGIVPVQGLLAQSYYSSSAFN
jgi:hypothetical protein